ncbi:MAG TPA: DUF952 domain-containing protein [Ignavibacteria bacterium]|nr:DUF952 domain-containing protein [Ignavibacteria bacterium]
MIYHIIDAENPDADLSGDFYIPESFTKVGFIHCSDILKIEESANRFFRGRKQLIILCINEELVTSEIITEDLYNSGYKFPHIYGPLNLNSVTNTFKIKSDAGGNFKFENKLSNLS